MSTVSTLMHRVDTVDTLNILYLYVFRYFLDI